MLPEVSVNTFLPVAVATGTATFIGRLFFGPQPAFHVPSIVPLPGSPLAGALVLLLYVLLGSCAELPLPPLSGACIWSRICSTASPALTCATASACCWSAF